MAITFRGVNNAAGENNGNTGTSTVSITPTLPAGTAAGDRVFVIQAGTSTSGATPSGWQILGTKDTTVGSGAVAASSGLRRMSVYWRDYDGVWTMPAWTLTSASNNSHWIGAVSITPTSGSAFNMPTISTVGGSFNTASTSYTDTTAASFTTHNGSMLIAATILDDNVTSTGGALTQTGATFGTVTERCDGGTATGNDVAGKIHTIPVTTGAAATATFTLTLSAASQGETLLIEQTESVPAAASTFADAFANLNAYTQMTNTLGGTVTVSGGNAVLPVGSTINLGSGIITNLPFDLTASSIVFKIAGVSGSSDTQKISLGVAAAFVTTISGVLQSDTGAGATWDPVTYPYLRLSHAGGFIVYEYSADGSTWTALDAKSSSGIPLAGQISIYALNQSFSTGQSFTIDEINPAIAPTNTGAFFAMF